MKQFLVPVLGLLVLAGCGGSEPETAQVETMQCDRACLTGLLDQYIDAIVAQDPSTLPVTADVRFTEDSKDLKLGAGLWQTKLTKGGFRQDYIDTTKQIAATHVQLLGEEEQILYSVVLHTADGKIDGIETLVDRVTPESRFQPTMLGEPLVGMNDPVPAGEKESRADAIQTALKYPEGLRIGSFVEAMTPFAEDAYRIENGSFMAGQRNCPREECPDILTQKIITHPDVQASVAAVDEEAGIVLLWMNFGDTNSYGPGNALITFEAFKVWGGQIHVVNAFFRTMPKETERGWPSAE